jgi:para-nitrobenzyl esterase
MTENRGFDGARRQLLQGSLAAGGLFAAQRAFGASLMEQEQPSPVVATRQGRVRGVTQGAVSVFRGIPYGRATGGKARFRPPAPAAAWDGIRDAVRFGDRCPQNPFPAALAGEETDIGTSEDCLSLNIWTPGLDAAARRPVMVWFHGGGFVIGHGSQKRYDGANLASANDVIVVSITHRLGAFGFLYLDELDPRFAGSGNASLLDCIAALEWVRDNIAAFGGDPGNVTVFGQSGGAAKISSLMAMPATRRLFHKAIVQSGSWLRAIDRETAVANAVKILANLQIDTKSLDALETVPAARLLAAANATLGPGLTSFGPIVDGTSLPRHPWTPDAPDIFADIPMMIGTTSHETSLFSLLLGGPDGPDFALKEADLAPKLAALLKLPADKVDQLIGYYREDHPGETPSSTYFRATTDAGLRHAAILQAERKAAQGGGAVYTYLFAWESPAMGGKLGAGHSADIPFVFNNIGSYELNGSGPEQAAFGALTSRTWATFARTGDPNHPGLPRWKPYMPRERSTLILQPKPEVQDDPGGRARALLQAHLPA